MSAKRKPGARPRGETPIVVLGAGGTGLLLADSVSRADGFRVAGFLDDDPKKQAEGCCGQPVLGGLSSWSELDPGYRLLSSVYGAKKNLAFSHLVSSLRIPEARWATLVDPRATVSPLARIGCGSYVGPGCVVEPLVQLGRVCALLGNVYVAHETVLGDYVVCANSASVAGGVSIGAAAYLGANSTVREYIRIGSGAVVGMGAVVVKDVAENATVVGNPARPLPRP